MISLICETKKRKQKQTQMQREEYWLPRAGGWELKNVIQFSSVWFSRSVVSDSLRPHESQHARPPCPSPTPGVYPNSCPSSWWYHPTTSSSVLPFSSCPQSFPASGSFPMSQLFGFESGGQSTGVSASASVFPMNTQDWSPLGWTGCISLQSKGLSRVFSNTTVQKHQFFGAQQILSYLHIVIFASTSIWRNIERFMKPQPRTFQFLVNNLDALLGSKDFGLG